MRKFNFPFLAIIFLLSSLTVFAEDIRVTSTFDRRTAMVGEEIRLTIKITGAQGNVQAPRLPSFNGFDTFYTGRASNITFINGQSSSSIEFSYVLVAKNEGRHTLSPIQVSISGRNFATDPIEIIVSKGSGGSGASVPSPYGSTSTYAPGARPQQTSPSGFPQSSSLPPAAVGSGQTPQQAPQPIYAPEDDNIFVRAWVDKTSVYANEQILLSYSLYTRYDTRYEGFDKEPQVSGFWIEEFPMDREVERERVRMNGKPYVKADVKKMALFPTAPAEYTIDPGTLKASIRKDPESNSVFDEFFNDSFFSGGGFFARREDRILKPPPIQITVKPLPEKGKPASFQGAVGNFRFSAELDKNTVKQNEPVTMKLVIEGEGNVETLKKPTIPELPNFKVYDADSSSQLFKTGDVIGGRKTFEIVFIPLEAGAMKIPSIKFSYFNPSRAAYNELLTPEFSLEVAPSDQPFQLPQSLSQVDGLKKDIELEAKDIRFISERLPSEKAAVVFDLFYLGAMGVSGLLMLLIAAGLVRANQEKVYAKDSSLRRRRMARANAEAGMRRLRGARSRKSPGFFDDSEKVLTQYLSDKFNLSAYGMTRYDVEAKFSQVFGSGDPLVKEIQEFYQICDESRFAKADIPEEQKDRVLRIIKETIVRVEKLKK